MGSKERSGLCDRPLFAMLQVPLSVSAHGMLVSKNSIFCRCIVPLSGSRSPKTAMIAPFMYHCIFKGGNSEKGIANS